MSASAAADEAPIVRIRGRSYPVLLPSLRDPRLSLTAVIVSLHVLGQVAFEFRLSIAQILVSLGTCALLEVAIAGRRQRVILWPTSALLTANGVAFILRVPGTEHGDWWSLNGWWIFVAASAAALLSKYLIRFRGRHVFNPSNIGLVLCFLVLSETRAEPLDFWWGPMSVGLVLALVLIVAGGFAILGRLRLVGVAVGFWLAFAAGIGVLALSGHAMTARWHLGPISGGELWRILVFSPEILVFLFFMIPDPKTIPDGRPGRRVFGVAVGLLAVLLIAPQSTEYASKVAVLGALALVCVARPLVELLRPAWSFGSPMRLRLEAFSGRYRLGRARPIAIGALTLAGTSAFIGLVVLAGLPATQSEDAGRPQTRSGDDRPQLVMLRSEGVVAELDEGMADEIASAALASLGSGSLEVDRVRISLEPGALQGPPIILATLEGPGQADARPASFERTFELVFVDGEFTVIDERDATVTATAFSDTSRRQPGESVSAGQQDADPAEGAEGKTWVARVTCQQAAADFDQAGMPPMAPDLAAYACDGVALTASQFKTQATAVCEETNASLAGLSAGEPVATDTLIDHPLVVAQFDRQQTASLRALKALDPPQEYLVGLEQAIEVRAHMSKLAEETSEAAAAGDEPRLEQLQAQYLAAGIQLDEIWTDLGIGGCLI